MRERVLKGLSSGSLASRTGTLPPAMAPFEGGEAVKDLSSGDLAAPFVGGTRGVASCGSELGRIGRSSKIGGSLESGAASFGRGDADMLPPAKSNPTL